MPNCIPSPEAAEMARWDSFFRSPGRDVPSPSRWLQDKASGLRPAVALDLGCGNGRNAIHLASAGWSVVGIDRCEIAVAQLRATALALGLPIRAVVGDLSRMTPARAFASLAILSYMPLVAAARLLTGALLPGGYAILEGFHTGAPSPAMSLDEISVHSALSGFDVLEVTISSGAAFLPETDGPVSSIHVLAQSRRSL